MPDNRAQRFQALIWLGFAGACVWLLAQLSPILAPFLLAAILAYIGNPGAEWLTRHRVPRSAAALLVEYQVSTEGELESARQAIRCELDAVNQTAAELRADLRRFKRELESNAAREAIARSSACGSGSTGSRGRDARRPRTRSRRRGR